MTNETKKQLHNQKAVLWTVFLTSLFLCILCAMPVFSKENGALLRFHVVAHSDTAADQADKEAVAEALKEMLLPCLEKAQDTKGLQRAILKNKKALQEVAEQTLIKRGNPQKVEISLGESAYGKTEEGVISLKEGVYPTLRVVIGEGEGHNCFSVLFPSLSLWVASDGTSLAPNLGKRGEIGAVKFRTYEVLSRFLTRK